jgi:hypothetical protein
MGAGRTNERETATVTRARKASGVESFIGILPGEGIGRRTAGEIHVQAILWDWIPFDFGPDVARENQRLHL